MSIADSADAQIEENKRISDTGIDAFVMVSNRLAAESDNEDVVKRKIEMILESVPDVNFGLYECPFPYKRLVSSQLLSWLADTNRFYFLKDTCCDLQMIKERVAAVKGKSLKIYNANTATLLDSYNVGINGFSGVMANFHPQLYTWLHHNWNKEMGKSRMLQSFLTISSLYELENYPTNAKLYLHLEGLDNELKTRTPHHEMNELGKRITKELNLMTKVFEDYLLDKKVLH
ncbi:dihydrodipicolinate synthase family protein [Bacillus sp. IITD106]|nr:dihydrodipicolinate synthase family protein [Bacillus sp. IITD106]